MEEVRDAMNQLEQGNVWTGGSESLMREMANTMELQRKLEDAMEKVVMGMTAIGDRGGYHGGKADPGERKREMTSTGRQEQEKDAEVLTSESSSLSSSRSEKEQEMPNKKKMKHGQTDSEMEGETWTTVQSFAKPTQLKTRDLARECLKTILNVKATNNKIQPDMKTSWSKAIIGVPMLSWQTTRQLEDLLHEQGVDDCVPACSSKTEHTCEGKPSLTGEQDNYWQGWRVAGSSTVDISGLGEKRETPTMR
ncbi:hypothetical protein PC121_g9093 [Phytophthora cactorum]|nr:hypothetical protein PC120_g12508 [Phytophthora cactorum]KAG3071890.1 hypothetical protein PC121_g9093 [Phytophthora cactorum]KAG4048231.1 hypothetical protein PC123_g16452 [Phytophthora cactorum]